MSNNKTQKKLSNLEIDFENTDFDNSEIDSLLSTEIQPLPKRINSTTFEFIQMTNVLSIICSIYLLIFILLNLRYVPNFYSVYLSKPITQIDLGKNTYFFDSTFSNLHLFSKTLLNINHLILVSIFVYIYNLNSKHYPTNRWSVKLFSFLGILSLICLVNLSYNYEISTLFFKSLGLKDNIVYSLYMLFTLCFLYQFSSIQNKSINTRAFSYVLYSIILNLLVYLVCLFVISFYHNSHFSDTKMLFMITVVICKEINSVLFHLNYMLFIFSVKSNLSAFGVNLNLNPDSESDDLEKNFKYTL